MPARRPPEPTDVEFTVVADPQALPGPAPVVPWYEKVARAIDAGVGRLGPRTKDRAALDRRTMWLMVAINPGLGIFAIVAMGIATLFGCAH